MANQGSDGEVRRGGIPIMVESLPALILAALAAALLLASGVAPAERAVAAPATNAAHLAAHPRR